MLPEVLVHPLTWLTLVFNTVLLIFVICILIGMFIIIVILFLPEGSKLRQRFPKYTIPTKRL